jgi:ectoine hydroxylase-related dioxygenase (phytanoyl-CoA dioxygenase family)
MNNKSYIFTVLLSAVASCCYAASDNNQDSTTVTNITQENKNISERNMVYPQSIPFKNIQNQTHPMTVINPVVFSTTTSKEFINFFNQNGYVVIDGISNKEDRDQLVELIDEIANKNIPETRRLAFMDLYHDKTLANLRQNENLYTVFTHIYETEKLWSVFDRVIYWNKDEKEMPLAPHVDQNPVKNPEFIYVQAMIALRDMDENTGTLALVPKSNQWFSIYQKWANQKAGYIEYEDSKPLDFIALRLKEGQIVIWDSRTTHSRFRGEPKANRYAALLTYTKAIDNNELLKKRELYYKNGIGFHDYDAGLRATAKPRYNQSLRKTPEQLTELGEKLYGVKSWFHKK